MEHKKYTVEKDGNVTRIIIHKKAGRKFLEFMKKHEEEKKERFRKYFEQIKQMKDTNMNKRKQ